MIQNNYPNINFLRNLCTILMKNVWICNTPVPDIIRIHVTSTNNLNLLPKLIIVRCLGLPFISSIIIFISINLTLQTEPTLKVDWISYTTTSVCLWEFYRSFLHTGQPRCHSLKICYSICKFWQTLPRIKIFLIID